MSFNTGIFGISVYRTSLTPSLLQYMHSMHTVQDRNRLYVLGKITFSKLTLSLLDWPKLAPLLFYSV